jgi:hypothetical protein
MAIAASSSSSHVWPEPAAAGSEAADAVEELELPWYAH